MKKVSFDFDGTLGEPVVREYAKKLVLLGYEVHITTSRFSDKNADERNWHWIRSNNKGLYMVAKECGILDENIHFTNGRSKLDYLIGENYLFHLDDDEIEIYDINDYNDPCIGVYVDSDNWIDICNSILNI